jgi:hypothetical protein
VRSLSSSVMNPAGHLNTKVLDHDSVVTALGKHDRVVCFQPDSEGPRAIPGYRQSRARE